MKAMHVYDTIMMWYTLRMIRFRFRIHIYNKGISLISLLEISVSGFSDTYITPLNILGDYYVRLMSLIITV